VSRRTNLEDAFVEASFLALPGDVILLAPACASFDEFSSYVERGKFFKELIAKSSEGAA
jgi:UDP-N-acetylmuramoylalanine--D-glutamate ligase